MDIVTSLTFLALWIISGAGISYMMACREFVTFKRKLYIREATTFKEHMEDYSLWVPIFHILVGPLGLFVWAAVELFVWRGED